MALISVILPVYNGEKTIQKTIESVLNQTFSDFELLIINDGSTDSTLDIVKQIDDQRIKVYSYKNAGVVANRNRGISLASGEYIAFIDADDLWTSDKLEAQFKALQDYPEAAVAYSWTQYIDEFDHPLPARVQVTLKGYILEQLLLEDFIGNGSNPLVRASAFAKVGGFNESLKYVEDWEMWLRLATHYPFVCVPCLQILYRMSSNSRSKNLLGVAQASHQILNQIFANSPPALKRIKRTCLGNCYKNLTCQSLHNINQREHALIATQFISLATWNDPSLILHKVFWKAWLKIAILTLLPTFLSSKIINKVHSLSNFYALILLQNKPKSNFNSNSLP